MSAAVRRTISISSQGAHGRRRVVDGRGKRAERDVGQQADGVQRVVLEGSLGGDDDAAREAAVRDGSAASHPRDGGASSDAVAQPDEQLEVCTGVTRQADGATHVEADDLPGATAVPDDGAGTGAVLLLVR